MTTDLYRNNREYFQPKIISHTIWSDDYESSDIVGVVAFAHQCDAWLVGDPSDVRALIDDLENVLLTWDTEAPAVVAETEKYNVEAEKARAARNGTDYYKSTLDRELNDDA